MKDDEGRRELDFIDLADMTEPIVSPTSLWDKIQAVIGLLFILTLIYGMLTQ